jgi:hypothetical protein
MADRVGDWLVAAACREGPQPRATFADLPQQHKREFVRFAIVAAASTASFIALWALSQPIRGRNLRSDATLPHGAAARSPLLEARLAAPIEVPSPAPLRPRATRPRATVQLASLREPVVGGAAPQERRRNVFSRFFRGVWRTIQPSSGKATADSL